MDGSTALGRTRRVLLIILFVIALTLTSAGVGIGVASATTKRVLANGKHYPKKVERWRSVVKKYFAKKHGQVSQRLQQEALAIIWVESGGGNSAGTCDGIWQLAHCHGTRKQRLSPKWATKTAAKIYRGQHRHWRPGWSVAGRLGLK